MENETPLKRLARIALEGQEPAEWARQERDKGTTWEGIAADLGHRIGTRVSRETVRLWANDTAEAQS